MKPQRPYLLRALYEWILDSDEVPYVVVDATVADVQVPSEHVQDGKIVLNIGPNAVRDLVMEEEFVMCAGRFSGRHFELCLPMSSIRAIYAKATGQGMVFVDEDQLPMEAGSNADSSVDKSRSDQSAPEESKTDKTGDDKPGLRLV